MITISIYIYFISYKLRDRKSFTKDTKDINLYSSKRGTFKMRKRAEEVPLK